MKKLLGLLAVAPLSLAACNTKEETPVISAPEVPQYESNEVRFVEAHDDYASQLIISHIELSSDTDYDGFDAVGKAIRDAYTANANYATATEVKMTGTVNGVAFNKTVDISGVHDNTDNSTPFANLKAILDYAYTPTADLTADGVLALNLKTAGTHIVPTEVTDAEYQAFQDLLVKDRTVLDSALTEEEWTTRFYSTDSVTTEYDITALETFADIGKEDSDYNIAKFDSSYFVFERYLVISHDRLIMYYHHEADPQAAEYVSWTVNFPASIGT